MESPRPHLHVVRLEDDAALRAPIAMEREDQVLEAQAQFERPRASWSFIGGFGRSTARSASGGSSSGIRNLKTLGRHSEYQEHAVNLLQAPACTIRSASRARRDLAPQAKAPQAAHPALWEVSRSPIRRSICSGRSTCFPNIINGVRPSSTRPWPDRSSSLSRPSSTRRTRQKLMSAMASLGFANGLPPLAERRAGGQARGARDGDQEQRISAAGARQDEDLGSRVHPPRQPVPRHGSEGSGRRRDHTYGTISRREGKSDRRARKQPSSSSASSTRCPKRRSGSCSRARSINPRRWPRNFTGC